MYLIVEIKNHNTDNPQVTTVAVKPEWEFQTKQAFLRSLNSDDSLARLKEKLSGE